MPGFKKLSALSYQLSDKKQNKSDDRRPARPAGGLKTDDFSTGFTLIEILVAISIVVIVSAVAVPNLKYFSNDQDLDNKTSELKNILRKAQSSALSNALCSNLSSSTSFYVSISQTQATLYSTCSTGPIETWSSVSFDSPIILSQTDCAINLPAVVTFINSQVVFTCNAVIFPQHNLSVTLLNQKSNQTKTINISKGGVIGDL